jgi:hypothetical protein
MTAPSAAFLAQEALLHGATPVIWFVFLPYYFANGIESGATFNNASYVATDKFLADDGAAVDPTATTLVKEITLGRYPTPAVISWDYNSPGYTMALEWRSSMTSAGIAAASWTAVGSGDTVQIYRYYQWRVTWTGYRSWASPDGSSTDLTAYTTPAGGDEWESYAAPTNHPWDSRTYITALLLTGEYPVPRGDVESGGQLTVEAPADCGNLVAGDHTLILGNRHRSAGLPAGRYSPDKSSFLFATDLTNLFQKNKQLRIELGYVWPGHGTITDTQTLYLGQIRKWGPLFCGVSSDGSPDALSVEVYSKDSVAQTLERKIGLPDSDGNPQPLIRGEILAEAKEVSGKGIGDYIKKIDYETGRLDAFSSTVASGGGVLSVNSTTPLDGTYSARAAITGASQSAYGIGALNAAVSEVILQFPWRFTVMPGAPVDDNVTVFKARDNSGSEIVRFFVAGAADTDNNGKLMCAQGGTEKVTDWSIATHDNIKVDVSLRIKTGNPGNVALWISGDQVLDWTDINLTGQQFKDIIFGLIGGASAESWTVDLGSVRFWDWAPLNAFQVPGYPFTEIKTIYVKKQVYSKATVIKYPEYGVVSFTEVDDASPPAPVMVDGEVMLRVVHDTVTHRVDQIEDILTAVGLDGVVDATTFASCKAATPTYLGGVRFENVSAAQAISEITRRCLYSFHHQGEVLKLIAYTGTPPAAAAISLDRGELRQVDPAYDFDTDAKAGVVGKWGWFDRNPALTYTAGDASDGDANEDMDFTVESEVYTDDGDMVKTVCDLQLKRISLGQMIIDPVRTSLRGARLELLDGVEVYNDYHQDAAEIIAMTQKIINLEPPYETLMRLVKYLGE